MPNSRRLLALLALGLSLWGPAAMAQATRTWVSGVGDDANPCSRTAPCKTFAGAISKTAIGGEINALDPAGYGALTITKSITIDGGGTFASTLAAGATGFAVNAPNGVVTLRNLSIQGVNTGIDGIRITQAKTVNIQNVDIQQFTQSCIQVSPTAGPVSVHVAGSVLSSCVTGLEVLPTAGIATTVTLENTRVIHNTTGVQATSADATVRLSNSTVLDNTTGLSAVSGSGIISFNNNRLRGNTTDGAPTLTIYER